MSRFADGLDEATAHTCPDPETAPDERADSCPSPQQLALLDQWNALQSAFRRLTDQVLGDVEAETGLAPSSFQVLWFLLTTPGYSAPMNQLTNTLSFTTAGTTNLADRLARAGLLERRPAPADRRVTLAVLTDKGRQTATTAARTLADMLQERVIAPLGPDALAKLADTVGSLAPTRATPAANLPPSGALRGLLRACRLDHEVACGDPTRSDSGWLGSKKILENPRFLEDLVHYSPLDHPRNLELTCYIGHIGQPTRAGGGHSAAVHSVALQPT